MRKSLWIIVAFTVCTVLTGTLSVAQDLDGSTVTGTLYNPDLSTILGGPTTATVGASTPTFPNGSILGDTAFQINITSDQLIYDPLANVTYGTGTFNGFVFDFSNAPTIVGVTVDSGSSFAPTGVSFSADSISLNLSGDTVTTSSTLILDISSTPEPATSGLMLTGIGLLGLLLMRRR